MTKRGQKRKSIDPATDSSKLPKIALADETIIQASNIDHSEAKEDKKDPNNTVEHENIVTCILIKDAQVTYDKALGSDATHIPLKETEMSENDVRLEINKTLTEIRTTSADNKVMDSFDVGADESNERHFQHASDEDKAKTEAVLTEKMAESIENLLPIFLSQKTTGTNTKSLSVPQLNYLHKNLSDENVENHATDVKMHSLSSTCTSGKADIVSLNEKAIPVSIPDDTKLFVSTKDSIGDANTRSETNETLNNGKDTKCDELKQDNIIEITAETSQTVTGMMHTDIKTKVTCHVELELEQEESSTDTDINSKMNSCNKELPVVKVDKTDDSDLEKCPEIPATKDKIETETSLGDTTEQEAPYKEIDKAEKHEDNVEPIEDEETKEREAPDIDTIERENEMEELDKNEDDIDSIQSQPVSHIDEEIYLQSTAPVNPEYNGSKQDEENIADETGEGLDTDYDAVPPSLDTDYDTVLPRGLDTDYRYDAVLPRSPPAALHVTRDGKPLFHSDTSIFSRLV